MLIHNANSLLNREPSIAAPCFERRIVPSIDDATITSKNKRGWQIVFDRLLGCVEEKAYILSLSEAPTDHVEGCILLGQLLFCEVKYHSAQWHTVNVV